MKRNLRFIIAALIGLTAVVMMSACDGPDTPDGTNGSDDPADTSVTTENAVTTTEATVKELKDDEIVPFVDGLIEELRKETFIRVFCGDSYVDIFVDDVNAPLGFDIVSGKLDEIGYDSEEVLGKYLELAGEQPVYEIDKSVVSKAVRMLYSDARSKSSSTYTAEGQKLTITVGEKQYAVKITATVSAVVEALESCDYADLEAVADLTNPAMPWSEVWGSVTVKGNNAEYKYVSKSENAVLVPEKKGYTLDIDAVRETYNKANPGDVLEFEAEPWDPEITAENIDSVLFPDEISSHTSYYNSNQYGRTVNLELAAANIDGAVILPGEYFSFNYTVGERTEENGFMEATVYENGEMVEGLGGGICQVSSTIFAASIRGAFTQGQRAAHQFTVDYVKLGEDATVYWGYLDYTFKNNYDTPIRIDMEYGGGALTVRIMGQLPEDKYEVYIQHEELKKYENEMKYEADESLKPGEEDFVRKGKPGYKISTVIYIYKNGEYSSSYSYTSVYDPYHGLTYKNPVDLTSSEITAASTTETTTSATTESQTTPKPTEEPKTTVAPTETTNTKKTTAKTTEKTTTTPSTTPKPTTPATTTTPVPTATTTPKPTEPPTTPEPTTAPTTVAPSSESQSQSSDQGSVESSDEITNSHESNDHEGSAESGDVPAA